MTQKIKFLSQFCKTILSFFSCNFLQGHFWDLRVGFLDFGRKRLFIICGHIFAIILITYYLEPKVLLHTADLLINSHINLSMSKQQLFSRIILIQIFSSKIRYKIQFFPKISPSSAKFGFLLSGADFFLIFGRGAEMFPSGAHLHHPTCHHGAQFV